jgi:hypothetical protein
VEPAIGLPHPIHASAASETSLAQSGHFTRAMIGFLMTKSEVSRLPQRCPAGIDLAVTDLALLIGLLLPASATITVKYLRARRQCSVARFTPGRKERKRKRAARRPGRLSTNEWGDGREVGAQVHGFPARWGWYESGVNAPRALRVLAGSEPLRGCSGVEVHRRPG